MGTAIQSLEPVPTLIARIGAELSADFHPDQPTRVSRAPGRLDVMGGIADYAGSLVCQATVDRAAAVALQGRRDRELQVFSFNLLDDHKPFTLRIPLDALASRSAAALRGEFDLPGRKWAAYVAGCLHVLHAHRYVDLLNPAIAGMSLAIYSTVPLGAGISSSAALEVATMMNFIDHFGVARVESADHARDGDSATASHNPPPRTIDALTLAALCQQVENQIVGAPCGIMDQVASCSGSAGSLLRMICQPHQLQPPLALPDGVRVLGINSSVRHSVGAGQYGRTRAAAFMAHKIILEKMREIGAASGRTLTGDPMRGYLANLDPDDYKRMFRPSLPPTLKGGTFLMTFGRTIDPVTRIEPDVIYEVLHAADHHVLEARRVENFAKFLTAARYLPPGRERGLLLDKAGHLMYASHLSYGTDAMLGAPECDLLVQLLRAREPAGLYGARITGGGSGGTVAVLANASESADAAIAEVMSEYRRQSGLVPELFTGDSPGAWSASTFVTHGI